MADIVIRNGRVVCPGSIVYGGIAITDGKIVHVGSNASLPQGKRVIDAKECFIIPGLIDPHTHMISEEDASIAEGIQQNWPVETDGALHGGVTTFGHFVGTKGKPTLPQVKDTIQFGEQYSYMDFFCHALVIDEQHIQEQAELFRLGVTSYKLFFNAYTPKSSSSLSWMGPANEGMLFRTLEFTRQQGYPALTMVHCEEAEIFTILEERLKRTERNDLAVWTEAHPNYVEYIRISHAIEIAKAVNAPLYIVHVSTAEGAELVSRARKQGYTIFGECCPHYLTHTCEMETEIGAWGKVNPALKYSQDVNRLWRGIRDGSITSIGTDCGTGGRTVAARQKGKGKYNAIWDHRIGIRGGLEHMLPVMMTCGVNKGLITIEELVKVCATNTAKTFGLYPRKGVILPGSDADIVIVDPEKQLTVDKHFYHCLCEVSIYEGWQFKGLAKTTLVRGEFMLVDYTTVGKIGWGQYIPCHAY